jgi:hypothetical protein
MDFDAVTVHLLCSSQQFWEICLNATPAVSRALFQIEQRRTKMKSPKAFFTGHSALLCGDSPKLFTIAHVPRGLSYLRQTRQAAGCENYLIETLFPL